MSDEERALLLRALKALDELTDLNSGWHGFPKKEQTRFDAATESGRAILSHPLAVSLLEEAARA